MAKSFVFAVLGVAMALAGCGSCEREESSPTFVGPPALAPRDGGLFGRDR